MSFITAEEARKISETNVQTHLKDAYNRIREAAYAGNRRVHLKDPFWCDNTTPYWQKAFDELTKQGFNVSLYRNYDPLRTDVSYTVVGW